MYSDDDFLVESHRTLHALQQEGTLCDVKLSGKNGERIIGAHRIILASKSGYFKAMFTSDMMECRQEIVTLESMSDDVLQKIIDYCYTGEIKLLPNDTEEILDAAHMLGLHQVSKKCFAFLRNNIDVSNCYGIAYLAEKYSCSEMRKIAEDFFVRNFRLVVNSPDFCSVDFETLINLISHNQLNVSSESDVYDAVMKWVKHNIHERRKYLKKLLSHVRFPMLNRRFLIDKVTKEDLILKDTDCIDYLYRALDYHLVPERRKINNLDEENHCARRSLTSAIYVMGGENLTGEIRTVEIFQLKTKVWQESAPLADARKFPSLAILSGNIYCVGGIGTSGKDLSCAEVFDPTSQKWSAVAKLNLCKGALSVAVLDGWLYAAGGSNGGSALTYVERYDPAHDEWTAVQQMKFPRCHFGIGTLNNKLYAIGGYNGICEVEHCEIFDPLTSHWKDMADLNKARMNHAVAVQTDKIFVIGGYGHARILDCIEKYNKGLGMWLIVKHTLDPKTGASVSLVKTENDEDWLFIVGGKDGLLCYHSGVKMINLKSIDYSIGSGKAMNEPRAYFGMIAM